MRVEENQMRVTTESQPLPGIEHATFRSQVRNSTNLAVSYHNQHRYKDECYTHFRLRGYIVLESRCLPWNTSACRRSCHTEVTVRHAAFAQPSIHALPTLSYQSLLTIGIGNGPVHVLVSHQSLTGDILSLHCHCQRVVFA